MATISSIDAYPVILRDKYWEVVTVSLIEIFSIKPLKARKLVSSLRQDLEKNLSPRWQLLVYHQEALTRAENLANYSPKLIIATQLDHYKVICERLGWTPEGVKKLTSGS